MTQILPTWPRRRHVEAAQKPWLFYVVYGAALDAMEVSRRRHRCDGLPAGLELRAYRSQTDLEVLDRFRSGYLWEELHRTDPELAAAVAAQQRCAILHGTCADAASLDYFRNAIGLLTAMLESGAVAVFDPQSLKWWSRAEWTSKVFEPGQPEPHQHVVILVSDEIGGTHWYHTRGLRKFGRPDLSLRGVKLADQGAVLELFNRLIEHQADGGVIDEGQEITMRNLPPGMTCRHRGDEDDPDFNNCHVEIQWAAR